MMVMMILDQNEREKFPAMSRTKEWTNVVDILNNVVSFVAAQSKAFLAFCLDIDLDHVTHARTSSHNLPPVPKNSAPCRKKTSSSITQFKADTVSLLYCRNKPTPPVCKDTFNSIQIDLPGSPDRRPVF